MTKTVLFAALLALSLGAALFTNIGLSSATFHLTRIDAAMGGYYGNTNVQYVELRSADFGQNHVAGIELCFFDATGAPYSRYVFPADAANPADGSSILIGTTEFDAAWPTGAPDFTFTAPNASAIAPGADANHPLRAPGGRIAFGADGPSAPFCAGNFGAVDSVAYGSGYTGSVDYGTKFASDMPTNSSTGLHLVGPVCIEFSAHLCAAPRDNSVDYSIADLNAGANQPRNNGGLQGPLTNDADNDGVANASDLCQVTAPSAPVDANGCSQAQVDPDTDGICSPGAPSAGPAPGCTGSDNCPNWPNSSQTLPSWTVPAGDADCDGFPDSVSLGPPNALSSEAHVGTNQTSHCAATATRNDEALDAWPPDVDDSQAVNGNDLLMFAPVFGKVQGNPGYDARYDLSNDNKVNGSDLLKISPFFGKHCV